MRRAQEVEAARQAKREAALQRQRQKVERAREDAASMRLMWAREEKASQTARRAQAAQAEAARQAGPEAAPRARQGETAEREAAIDVYKLYVN